MASVQPETRVQVIGVDLSSRKIALVWETEDGYDSQTISVKKAAFRARELNELQMELGPLLSKIAVNADETYVYIEAPVVGRGGARPTILQSQVDGVVQAVAYPFATGTYSVNNKTWKKAVVGNGNSKKEDVAAWLAADHPVLDRLCDADQDLVDAACVCLYGRDVIDRAATI